MCVIIYVPKESNISVEEITNAWTVNPDGAGYSIQKDGKVYFKRGFMNLSSYLKEIVPLIGRYNLMLHFRISTSKAINKIQTHPYKKGDVTITEGSTKRPVICMNGIINGQVEYRNCNDTMSYIIDHQSAFANINQDILNIIEDATGAKWAVMTPEEVLLSSKFQKENGKFYSNKNHLWRTFISYRTKKRTFNNTIKEHWLKNKIRKDKELHTEVMDYIDTWCNDGDLCEYCTDCLRNAKTVKQVRDIVEGEKIINDCCFIDEYYNDIYDYGNQYNYNLFDE